MGQSDSSTRDLVPGFAALVKTAREALNMSMAELSAASGVGASTISAIEREARAPSLRVASALAKALNLKVWLDDPAKPIKPKK